MTEYQKGKEDAARLYPTAREYFLAQSLAWLAHNRNSRAYWLGVIRQCRLMK